MRIVVATTSYPERAGDPAGHFVEAHARAEARRGADVVVVAPGPAQASFEEAVGAGRVRVIRAGGAALFSWPGAATRAKENPARLFVAPFALAGVARALRREGPFDQAIAHWLVPSAVPMLELVDAPLLAFAHGADVRLLLRVPAFVRVAVIERLVSRGATVRFVAKRLQDELTSALPDALARRLLERSVVEPAPIDVPPRSSLEDPRVQLGLASGQPYIAWVGRVVASKRPALAAAAAKAAGLPLIVAGDCPELAGMLAGAGKGVLSAGLVPRDRALAIVANASALLHTSAAEGAPTVIREARALGVPVVACAAGDVASWAETDAGIFVTPDDVESLAGALRQAIRGDARIRISAGGGQS